MARKDGRLESGQPLHDAVSARAWNRAQDAADIVLGCNGGSSGVSGLATSSPYTAVYAKNGGSDLARWGILAITGVEITPTGSSGGATAQFESMPVLTGAAPSDTTTAWCVAVEPIKAGKIGRVAVAGVVQVKVADLGKAAGAGLLWKNSEWALVSIGSGGMRLGTISASWSKGSTATVTEQNGDGSAKSPTTTFTAKNYFATVTVTSGTKRVACAKVDDTWILLAAECD
jgi:hypothetical protein